MRHTEFERRTAPDAAKFVEPRFNPVGKLSFEPAWLYSSSVIVDSLEAGQTVRNSSHRAYSFGMLLIVFSPYVYDCE
ncbi:hypothetical protein D3C76_1807880 [compost metagenome]